MASKMLLLDDVGSVTCRHLRIEQRTIPMDPARHPLSARHLILRAFVIAFPVLGALPFAVAQPFWSLRVGSPGNDRISDVKSDAAGNLFVTGEFSGTADFGEITMNAVGGLDAFVAKVSPDGEVIWFKSLGGYGLDRGIKLALGPSNTLAVTGEFMGTADFQGTTLVSQNYTADMFTALFDRTTGTMQWVRQGGGALAADRPYGVTIAPSGQVTIAGEFKGTAAWDGFSLTSTPDQDSGIPTQDVVVVSYAADGTPLWVQQGAADRADRAIDVVNDPQGNIYVAGQFSDTITFDQTHLNPMYNATFLLKLDPAGQEVWFRRCGGAVFDHVRDMLYTPGGELLLTGDLQGNMIFLDSAPDMITGQDPYNYYLLRVGTDGELIASEQVGSENGLSAGAIDLRNDTVVVLGQFNCQFTDMSTHYGGTGLFMAAGEEDLFLSKHRFSDLGFIESRQVGGPGTKLYGQVAILPDGDVVCSGSFERSVSYIVEAQDQVTLDWWFPNYDNLVAAPEWYGDCGWFQEQGFRGQSAIGLTDGLLARVYERDSVVYDWWHRMDPQCAHDTVWTMCVGAPWGSGCPDTVTFCGIGELTAQLPFPPSFDEDDYQVNSAGPLVTFEWNNGDTTISITVITTGWYAVDVESVNGCWAWSDSVYAVVNPMPPVPLISDDVVVNTNSSNPEWITLCDPEVATIWCSNIDPSTDWYWSTYVSDTLPPDTFHVPSITVDTTGYWWFTMTTDAGCSYSTPIGIQDLGTPVMPDLTMTGTITFPQDSLGIDSVWLCANDLLHITVDPQWYINGLPVDFPADLVLQARRNGGTWSTVQDDEDFWTWSTYDHSYGWNVYELDLRVLNAPCGDDTLLFHLLDSIWVATWPVVPVNVSVSGPPTICVGDSVQLTGTCTNCTSNYWSGPGVSGETDLTVWIYVVGTYQLHGVHTDIHGCISNDYAYITVQAPPGPLLNVDPPDGIICPNDSAHIWTITPGTYQIWYGPAGPVPNNSQHLWSALPGEYYLTMVDLEGCFLTSDPVLLTGYGTPYLNVAPDNVLCLENDEATIQVVTTVPSSIVWAPPLSGNALLQTVTSPGTYAVTSTACGITTELEVTIVASTVQAEVLDPGPFVLCPGDSVVLEAVTGQAIYVWQPLGVYASSVTVTTPGQYTLQAIDGNGCTDTSAPIEVSLYTFSQPLVTTGDTICAGDDATLMATGSDVITWYADAQGSLPVGTGGSISVPGMMADTVLYVQQSDGVCATPLMPVHITVLDLSTELSISGPGSVCSGSSVTLTAFAEGATDYAWSTPGGPFTGMQVVLTNVTAADAGLYICTASAGNCATAVDTFLLQVSTTGSMDIGANVTICPGATALFAVPVELSDVLWNGVPGGDTAVFAAEGWVVAQGTDANGCVLTDSAWVDLMAFGLQLTTNDVEICAGNSAVLNANGTGTLVWSTEPDMDPVVGTGGQFVTGILWGSVTYFVQQTENGCASDIVPVQVNVLPLPGEAELLAPSLVCTGDTLIMELVAAPGVEGQWDGPAGPFTGTTYAVFDVEDDAIGLYTVVPMLGMCAGDTLEAYIFVRPAQPFSVGPDTSFCIGGTVVLSMPPGFTDLLWSTGSTATQIAVGEEGTYSATAVDFNGCPVVDEVLVVGEECAPLPPNVITPNGDGVNDGWSFDPAAYGCIGAELRVYNRGGALVFRADPASRRFAGRNDAGEVLSDGVYYYVLRLDKLNGTFVERTGYLQLMR